MLCLLLFSQMRGKLYCVRKIISNHFDRLTFYVINIEHYFFLFHLYQFILFSFIYLIRFVLDARMGRVKNSSWSIRWQYRCKSTYRRTIEWSIQCLDKESINQIILNQITFNIEHVSF